MAVGDVMRGDKECLGFVRAQADLPSELLQVTMLSNSRLCGTPFPPSRLSQGKARSVCRGCLGLRNDWIMSLKYDLPTKESRYAALPTLAWMGCWMEVMAVDHDP
ncbi:hypothetical protein GWK47_008421 [Chionoecetes opilio]|uniref:Uncharacterized protein n=1 Tax=Chionoecetes opilio TaxID=41210 RepID=A0A8J4XZP1_CHIOP|nr:hypothetical protein GWK47_008421 [Chionoecetes opilio]